MTATELDLIVEVILKTNDAPTDDQRHELATRLGELENDFQRIAGQVFSSDLLSKKDIPPDVGACGRSVQRYRLALSCLRSLPDEIWARIFEEGLSTWWLGNHEYLQVLEQPPDIDLPDIFDLTPLPLQIRNLEPKLRVYLSRSGGTPLSINFKTSQEVWNDSDARSLTESNLLSLLIAQCHRWQSLELCLPADMYNTVLHPIKGNMPLLQTLQLIVIDPSTSQSQLRALDLNYNGPGPALAFGASFTLTKLERLTLYANQRSLSLFTLFELITLPALSRLTIRGEFSPLESLASSVCKKVLDLIKRSKCSLQHLSFEFPLDTRQEAIYHILSLSPDLEYLEVPHLDSEGLRRLVLTPDRAESSNPSASHPNILPKLKILKLCWYGDFDSPETNPPYFPLNETGIVDASALKDVVHSRTQALYALNGDLSRESHPLEEVDLRRYDAMKLESDWNKATNTNVEETSDALAQEIEEDLDHIHYYGWTHPDERELQDEDRANPDVHTELDRQIRKMESIDLESYPNTLVFARRNIPHFLEEIRTMNAGRIPGDDIFDFRGRVGKLSDKWKPFILRDARKSPYSWRYTANVAANLTCHTPTEIHADQEEDEDERVWARIISYHP
ncbi:hypothetical protein H1R20_g16055, partial [Candolleomyces eurysporus]